MMTCCRRLFANAIVPSIMVPSIIMAASVFHANTSLAAQANNAFTVSVKTVGTGNPSNPIPDSAFCRSTTSGVTITVVCKTGAFVDIEATGSGAPWRPTHGGAYRFITQFAVASNYRDTIASNGVGTVSRWRTINLHDRDYLELLIGW
ncbi:MAG: hypothetical protein ACKE5M_00110 [Methylophilaceae bacterium]